MATEGVASFFYSPAYTVGTVPIVYSFRVFLNYQGILDGSKKDMCIICTVEFFGAGSLLRVEHICKKCTYDT